jgi:predicted Zn-dependent protease
MAMKDDDILQTSRYVDGEMDEAEQKQFEALLTGDAELRAYVAQYRDADAALLARFTPDVTLNDLQQTLKELSAEHFKPEAKVISFKPYIKWLSGIAAVLAIGLMIYIPTRKSLYDQYSTATSMSVAERGAGPQTQLEKAAEYYNHKEFTAAETLLAKEYAANPKNSQTAYYYAITLIQNKQEAKARVILQQLYKGESVFKYDAAWYMALSYVKVKDEANAKVWLEKIPAGTSNYKKAMELKGKL